MEIVPPATWANYVTCQQCVRDSHRNAHTVHCELYIELGGAPMAAPLVQHYIILLSVLR